MKALSFRQASRLNRKTPLSKKPGEALIKVRLAGICRTDLEIVKGTIRKREKF